MERTLSVLFLSLLFVCAHSQSLTDILRTIEENNAQLKALRESNAAIMAETRSENALGATSVEYSPFYQSGVAGTSSSELIVSQEFDFPTLYAARRKSASLQQQVLDLEYATRRRDILLEAEKLCYDLSTAQQNATLLSQRMADSDSLLAISDKRLRHGDATAIEHNRVRLDRMTLQRETAQNEATIDAIRLKLQQLNGGQPLSANPSLLTLPSEENAMADGHSLETSVAQASVAQADQQVKVSQQEWLPKLSVGYRRNTELREASNGFLIGVSMPLFSNSSKVKAARRRQSAAEQQLASVRVEEESRILSLRNEATALRQQLSTYDVPLMQQTLSLLMRGVKGGAVSIADYYLEADRIHSLLQQRLETENRYNKVMCDLLRNTL